jgi:ribosomal protein S18 acetylase RimI-like enzyme
MASPTIDVRRFKSPDVSVLAALDGAEQSRMAEAVAALERWLAQPGMQPERDCIIASIAGRPAGYAYVMVETPIRRSVLLAGIPAGHASAPVEKALLEEATAHARGFGLRVLDVDVPERDAARQTFLVAQGLRHVRTHWHLQRESAERCAVALPPGGTLRMAVRSDAQALTDLQNAAFSGSWGYSPNVVAEVEYRVFDLQAPADDVILLEIDGELAAYCWTHREGPDGPGIVGMVGTQPGRQGQGHGKVVTGAGIDRLLSLGAAPVQITVDRDNEPAVRLYRGLGFELDWRSLWFELDLTKV